MDNNKITLEQALRTARPVDDDTRCDMVAVPPEAWRVIRAALSAPREPDLLDALENICQRLEQMQYDHNTCDGDLVLEKARAAIAKAKGEQQ